MILLAMIICLNGPIIISQGASADTPTDFSWETVDNGTSVKITSYHGSDTIVTIPDVIDGKPVTVVGEYAFLWCTEITSIVIPDSVLIIDEYAFYGCNGLTTIDIPGSVVEIGNGAFYWCVGLSDITVDPDNTEFVSVSGVLYDIDLNELIMYPPGRTDDSFIVPDGITAICNYSFMGCNYLQHVVFPLEVVDIGQEAFAQCAELTEVALHNVETIGDWAFCGCRSLCNLTLGSELRTIGKSAFYECYELTFVTIPRNTTSIGPTAFVDCTSLTYIDVEAGNVMYSSLDGVLFDHDRTVLIQYPCDRTDTNYTVPNGVMSIANSAFMRCGHLTSISFPSSLISIGDSSFYDCPSLVDMWFHGDVPTTGPYWVEWHNFSLVAHHYARYPGFFRFGRGDGGSVNTAIIPPSAPSMPMNLTIELEEGYVALSWTAPEDDGGSEIDYYIIYQDGVDVKHVTGTATDISELTDDVEYVFTIAAHNVAGTGVTSSSAQIAYEVDESTEEGGAGIDLTVLIIALVGLVAVAIVIIMVIIKRRRN